MVYHHRQDPYEHVECYQYTSPESLDKIKSILKEQHAPLPILDRGQYVILKGFAVVVKNAEDFQRWWKPYQEQLELFEGEYEN